jgi:hypothetical protein
MLSGLIFRVSIQKTFMLRGELIGKKQDKAGRWRTGKVPDYANDQSPRRIHFGVLQLQVHMTLTRLPLAPDGSNTLSHVTGN